MSMFFSLLLKPLKLICFIILLIILSKNALSWSGFDNDSNSTIEIGPGNLVRENSIVTIFDWKTDSYHDVEILNMESSFNGVRMEVMDLETNKKRVFEME